MIFCLYYIQDSYLSFKDSIDEASDPVIIIGEFLNHLFEGHNLPCRYHFSSHLLDIASPTLARKLQNIVHFCPGYSQCDLIKIIVDIYDDHIPESFEVLHCHSHTSEEDISQFMKRTKYFPGKYLFLEVNKLPYELQEVQRAKNNN